MLRVFNGYVFNEMLSAAGSRLSTGIASRPVTARDTAGLGSAEVVMAPKGVAGSRGPRVGLVLGAGGVLGAAWMVGALVAVQERLGSALSEAELVVGTSAGSVLAAALRCGVNVDEMVAHQRGGAVGPLATVGPPDLGSRALPPPPLLRVGSPRLVLAAMRAPHRMSPWVAVSALVPQGRARHVALHAMVHTMASYAWPHLPPPHGRTPGMAGTRRTTGARGCRARPIQGCPMPPPLWMP